MAPIIYPVYLLLALLPSFIWLNFFLRKDSHPESNFMITRVFVLGMLFALPAAFLEIVFFKITGSLAIPATLAILLNTFFGVALIEETSKYFAVKATVLKNSELDEPIDIVLYMIISALGFAALENILILSPLIKNSLLQEAVGISVFRFLGATFLHTLVSGTLGVFIALSFREPKKRLRFLVSGFFIAVFSHGIYNFSITDASLLTPFLTGIITDEQSVRLYIPLLTLAGLAIFLSFAFAKLKKMKSICQTHS